MGIAVAGPALAEPRSVDEGRLILAQGQTSGDEEERKKRQEQRRKEQGGGGDERRGGGGGDERRGGGGDERRGGQERRGNQEQQQGGGGERRGGQQQQGGGEQQQERRQRVEQERGEQQNERQRGQQQQEQRQRVEQERGERQRAEDQQKRERAEDQQKRERAEDQQKRERAKQDNEGPRDRKPREQADGPERRQGPQQGEGGQQPERRAIQGRDDAPGDRGDRGRAERRDGPPRGDRDPRRTLSNEQMEERRKDRREFSRERLKDITGQRRERQEGGRIIIEEPGNRRIERDQGRAIIRHDETERFRGGARDFRVERGEGGRNRTVVTRPNGVQIISIQDGNGRLVRRIRRGADGREVILINNEFERGGRSHRERERDRDDRNRGDGDRDRGDRDKGDRDHGDRDRGDRRGGGFGFYIDLPEPVIRIPRGEYYVDGDDASEDEIEEALSAEPIDDVEGDYTLDEIRYSDNLRKRLRRVNLSSINFEFGSWEIRQEHIGTLQEVADVLNRILDRRPEEVFLIGGHTDAVGSDEDNLSLSDRRAETVARVLTDEFGVPPENLVTQGYGEQDLLIPTESAEIRNRRVEFMRITPFLAQKEE